MIKGRVRHCVYNIIIVIMINYRMPCALTDTLQHMIVYDSYPVVSTAAELASQCAAVAAASRAVAIHRTSVTFGADVQPARRRSGHSSSLSSSAEDDDERDQEQAHRTRHRDRTCDRSMTRVTSAALRHSVGGMRQWTIARCWVRIEPVERAHAGDTA